MSDEQDSKKAVTTKELAAQQRDTEARIDLLDESVQATQRQVAELGKRFETGFGELADLMRGMQAQHVPIQAARSETLVEGGERLGTAHFVEGGDEVVLKKPGLIDVESPEFKARVEYDRFMKDRVEIHVQEVNESYADPRFEIGVNGRQWKFERGRSYAVPRYVVYALAKCRPMRYSMEERVAPDGSREYVYPSSRGQRYPFSVTADPAGQRGAEWLRRVLIEP